MCRQRGDFCFHETKFWAASSVFAAGKSRSQPVPWQPTGGTRTCSSETSSARRTRRCKSWRKDFEWKNRLAVLAELEDVRIEGEALNEE